jgi:prepilin peptidase dependent protein B
VLNIYKRNKWGFTFTEMLVALAINGFILSALAAVFIGNLNHYTKSININRLNQQLDSAINLMANDLRRAGYWANANSDVGAGTNNNPFVVTGTTDIQTNGTNNCILFTYDHDSNSALPSISASYDDERYGYRLMSGALQTRPPGATFSCTAAAGNWENVTDPNFVTITALTFTITTRTLTTGPGSRGLALRSVDISLTGRLTSDSTVTRTLTQHVRLRNDKFIP